MRIVDLYSKLEIINIQCTIGVIDMSVDMIVERLESKMINKSKEDKPKKSKKKVKKTEEESKLNK